MADWDNMPGSSGGGGFDQTAAVQILLKLAVDPASRQVAMAELQELRKAMQGGGGTPAQLFDKDRWLPGLEDIDALKEKAGQLWDKWQQAGRVNIYQGTQLNTIYKQIGEYQTLMWGDTQGFVKARVAATEGYAKTLKDVHAQEVKNETQTRNMGRAFLYLANAFQEVGRFATIAGAAITGGLVLSAEKYIKSQVEINDLTREWKKMTDEQNDAQLRIGRTSAQVLLPAYQHIADIQKATADLLEKYPQIAQAAAVGGTLLTGIGSILVLLGQGIRLYADVSFALASQRLVESNLAYAAATNEFVGGVGLFGAHVKAFLEGVAVEAGGDALPGAAGPAAAGGLAMLWKALGIVFAVAAGEELGRFLANQLKPEGQKANFTLGDLALSPIAPGGGMALQFAISNKVWEGLANLIPALAATRDAHNEATFDVLKFAATILHAEATLEKLESLRPSGPASGDLPTVNGLSAEESAEYMKQAGQAYADFRDAELDAVRRHDQDLLDARTDWENRDLEIAKEYGDRVNEITKSNAESVARINSQYATQLQSSYANFALSEKHALEDYAAQRQEIIRDEGEKIHDIEADLQKKLRRLALDHEDKMWELATARDALGLVREQRAYSRARSEAEEDANDQIGETRRDTANRLRENKIRFELERKQRQENFDEQMRQAAAAHARQLAEQQKNYLEQLAEAAKRKAEEEAKAEEEFKKRMLEIEKQYREEENARTRNFIKQLNKLDKQFKIENHQRDLWYKYQYDSLKNWLSANRSAVDAYWSTIRRTTGTSGTSGTAIVHDFTGYAGTGLYAMAQNGMDQFVLGGQATRSAESLLGGQLNERVMMTALALGAGSMKVAWNDHRRFDGEVTSAMRRATRQDTEKILKDFFR